MKNCTLALFPFVILMIKFANAQTIFQKAYKGSMSSFGMMAEQTYDGGFIITGGDDVLGSNNHNVYLIKTDSLGDTIWSKCYGGIESDIGFSVQQTADSGFIITGYSLSINGVNFDNFLIRTNSLGDTLWTKGFDGTGTDYAYFTEQTNDGGFTFTGTYKPLGFLGAFIAKTDSAGNLLWSKAFEADYWFKYPQIHQTKDHGYILVNDLNLPVGNTNIHLLKIDFLGNKVWSKMYDLGASDHGFAVRQTADGGYIITGATVPIFFDSYIPLIKTDSIGNVLWAKVYGGSYDDHGLDVRQTSDGGYIITGNTAYGSGSGDIYLIKTDSIGNLLWSKTNSPICCGYGYSVQETLDGGYSICGWGLNGSVYLMKTDSLGNSNCNEYNPPTTVAIPTVITSIPPTALVNISFNVVSTGFVIGAGVNVTDLCTSGIEEETLSNSICIIPNPTSGNFAVSFKRTIIRGNIEILNIIGESVFVENIYNEPKKEINLKTISSGIYFVKVFDGEKIFSQKIIVQ